MVSKRQLKAIRRNYAKRGEREDNITIISTLLNIPTKTTIALILFISLYGITKYSLFLLGAGIIFLLDVYLFYKAFTRTTNRWERRFS
jgi:hypothetical protein